MATHKLLSWRWWLGLREKEFLLPPPRKTITAIIPAWNEEKSLAETIRSLQAQTYALDEIIVVDDFSDDATGDVARGLGVRVIRTEARSGTKARALNRAIEVVTTELYMVVDADTALAPDAVYEAMRCFNHPDVTAACGMVIPRYLSTFWEYSRLGDYLYSQMLIKAAQEHNDLIFVMSGCFTIFKTSTGGFKPRTIAEDMDKTWEEEEKGARVCYARRAICYPVEPATWEIYYKQLNRWYCGFLQNLKVRKFRIFPKKKKMAVLVYAYLLWFALSAFTMPVMFYGLFTATGDVLESLKWMLCVMAVFVWTPAFIGGFLARVPLYKVAIGLAAYMVIPYCNIIIFAQALWKELVLGKALEIWDKGH